MGLTCQQVCGRATVPIGKCCMLSTNDDGDNNQKFQYLKIHPDKYIVY